MKETYLYHGHSIDLDLRGMTRERIRWTYFIDEHYCVEGAMDSLPIESVRISALALAHRSIEALDSMRSESDSAPASRASESSSAPRKLDLTSQRLVPDLRAIIV